MTERLRQDAVLRTLEIIGEAVKKISDETRQRRPEIPWKRIAGLCDRLVHGYFGVDLALVWVVVDRDLSALSEAVEALLAGRLTTNEALIEPVEVQFAALNLVARCRLPLQKFHVQSPRV